MQSFIYLRKLRVIKLIIKTHIIYGNIEQTCREIPDLLNFFKKEIGEEPFGWMLKNKNNPERMTIEKETILKFIEKNDIVCKYDILFSIGSNDIIHIIEVFKTNKCLSLIKTKNIINSIRNMNNDLDIEMKLNDLEKTLGIYTPDNISDINQINKITIV